MTVCTENITKIDYCSIEFKVDSISMLASLKGRLIDLVRSYNIRVGSKKPHSMANFDDGNLLYSDSSTIDKKSAGSLKWQIKKGLVKIEFNGSQCEKIYLNSKGFRDIYTFAVINDAVLRRLDICCDDVSGKYNIRRAKQDYSSGKYNGNTGAKPKSESIKSVGSTFYIGSKLSYKFLRIYDKWAELSLTESHPLYKVWTRHELVLKNQGKIKIPLKALLNPDEIFLGAYPKAHRKFMKGVTPISIERIASIKVSSTVYKKLISLKKQRGRIIKTVRDIFVDDKKLLDVLCRNGVSASLNIPEFTSKEDVKKELSLFFQSNELLKSNEGNQDD